MRINFVRPVLLFVHVSGVVTIINWYNEALIPNPHIAGRRRWLSTRQAPEQSAIRKSLHWLLPIVHKKHVLLNIGIHFLCALLFKYICVHGNTIISGYFKIADFVKSFIIGKITMIFYHHSNINMAIYDSVRMASGMLGVQFLRSPIGTWLNKIQYCLPVGHEQKEQHCADVVLTNRQ